MSPHPPSRARRRRPGAAGHTVHLSVAGNLPRKTTRINQSFEINAIGYVRSGRGTYRVDAGPPQPVRPGTLFSVYPGAHFEYGPDAGTSWNEYHVGGTGPGIARWLELGWIPEDGRVYELARPARLHQAFEALLRIADPLGPANQLRRLNLAERVLIEAYDARTRSLDPAEGTPTLAGVLEHLRNNLAEPIDFEALARAHGMSYSKLRQGVKRRTGLAPAGYVTRLRCDAAERLLRETDESVARIGEQVGIDNPYLFSRVFKRTVGMPPMKYRQQTAGFAAR